MRYIEVLYSNKYYFNCNVSTFKKAENNFLSTDWRNTTFLERIYMWLSHDKIVNIGGLGSSFDLVLGDATAERNIFALKTAK